MCLMKSNLLKIVGSDREQLAGWQSGGEPPKSEGKGFHTEEANFLRGFLEPLEFTKGRENFMPTRL
jgi:hypothetical protein